MKVPQIYVQESIAEVLKDAREQKIKSESFWVNIDGKDQAFIAENNGQFQGPNHYSAALDGTNALNIYHNNDSVARILLGSRECSLKQIPKITCGDIAAGKTIVGTENGSLKLLITNGSGTETVDLGGHYIYTSVAKFFPSEKVALSAGMDYSLKLWDLNPDALADKRAEIKKLQYQRGLVDDVVMIGRGRNLFSLCSADSERAVVLWETGASAVVAEYAVEDAKCIALWQRDDSSIKNPDLHDGDGKIGLAGAANQTVLIDFREEKPTPLLSEGSDLIAVSENNLYRVLGSSLLHSDLRMPTRLLQEIVPDSPDNRPTQLVTTAESVVFRNSLGTYKYTQRTPPTLDVLCCENYGILVGKPDEVANLGTELRVFHM